jgi:hypothetical protein
LLKRSLKLLEALSSGMQVLEAQFCDVYDRGFNLGEIVAEIIADSGKIKRGAFTEKAHLIFLVTGDRRKTLTNALNPLSNGSFRHDYKCSKR